MKKYNLKFNIVYIFIVCLAVMVISIVIYGNFLENKYPWHIYENNSFKLLDDFSGEGVTIAFLDTGLEDSLLESFGDRIINPFNVITNTSNVSDANGHGTEMICVSSCSFLKNDIYGLAYKANIMPIVVVDDDGRTDGEQISNGIIYAVDNGADIINLSLGSRIENDLVKEAIDYAYNNNVIVVSSVGDYQDGYVLYPAKYETVIAVQSQSKLGVKYKDSSWGAEVDMLIPGEFIQTKGVNSDNNKLETMYISGSSISTAYFTSIIALLIQGNEIYTVNDILEYIREYEIRNEFIDINLFVRGYQ